MNIGQYARKKRVSSSSLSQTLTGKLNKLARKLSSLGYSQKDIN